MKNLDGRVAAITGAASGIGRALAVELSGRGCHLALCDLDEVGLGHTVALIGSARRTTASVVDVANTDAMFAWADRVVSEHGSVHLIVNNAGVNLADAAQTQSIADVRWVMDINFWGVVHGTQAFLPHLKAAGEGHVVNVSSVFGLVSIPSQSAYNAAKFAVRGYTESLRMELELEGANVSATSIHPGGIKTNIARNGRSSDKVKTIESFDAVATTTPEKAARQIVRAIERNRRRALIGPDAKVFDLVSRMPVGMTHRIIEAAAKRSDRLPI